MLPSPPAFARGGCNSKNNIRGRVRRRQHHYYSFSDQNIVDLRRLDSDGNLNDLNNDVHAKVSGSSEKNTGKGTRSLSTSSPSHHHHNNNNNNCGGSSGGSFHSSKATVSLCSSRGCEPPSKILDFLFIGGVSDATNAEFLRRENIVTILNVSREEYWSVDRSAVIYPFPVDDTSDANIRKFFRQTYTLLEHARRAYYSSKQSGMTVSPCVLVHCQRGRSRSATIVLAYLIRRNGWTVAEALQYVTCRRPCVEPNLGFMDALREYQESMDTEERTQRRSSLCLAVRNLSRSTASSFVHLFFEDHVGCVQGVMIHSSRPNKSDNNNGNSDQNNNDNNNGSALMLSRGYIVSDSGIDNNNVDGSTLCLVFFSAAECVRIAKKLFLQRPELFNALGTIDGKELKLTVPSKLIGPPKTKKESEEVEQKGNK